MPEDNDFHAYAQSKADADHLRASSLTWTILGPECSTDERPTGAIALGRAGEGRSNTTAHGNVALVAARVLAVPRGTARSSVETRGGDTPVAEAVGTARLTGAPPPRRFEPWSRPQQLGPRPGSPHRPVGDALTGVSPARRLLG
ncbi:NAD(P)H-binding protein [Kocuria rhizophila]|nr:NAD(P)H-binding protein [Kocuria rhizophila]